jgi:alkanesulfonate monooxygenase SsuD/methylene tetrahydromethanopterin reductase-like flavin-dependent oxidoreductase (luciferase family)
VKFGIVSYNTEYGLRPDDAAREAQARGFESIWFPEHTNIPVSRDTPFALGGDLPEQYKHFMDIFVSMTAAACAAPDIKIGAGICLLAQHDPIIAAKAVATLDYVSGGRVLFGIGGGWNREELENHGVRFADRWKVLHERIAAMKRIWTEEEAS